MTTANKVTIGRIILVPFFVVQLLYYFQNGNELHRLLACGAFLTATISDFIDGYLARNYGQATQLGSYLDPIADKLLLFSGLVLLTIKNNSFDHQIPLFLTGTVIGRDVIVVFGSVLLYVVIGDVKVKPHWLSKTASVLQMICIGWVLLKFPVTWAVDATFWLALAVTACTIFTGVLYVCDGIRQFSEHPAGQPGGGDSSS